MVPPEVSEVQVETSALIYEGQPGRREVLLIVIIDIPLIVIIAIMLIVMIAMLLIVIIAILLIVIIDTGPAGGAGAHARHGLLPAARPRHRPRRGRARGSGVHKGGFSQGGFSNWCVIIMLLLLNTPLLNPPLWTPERCASAVASWPRSRTRRTIISSII